MSKSQGNKNRYLNYNRIYKQVIRKAEHDYYTAIFDIHKNSLKSIWKNINTICSLSKCNKRQCDLISDILVDGNTITENVNMSNQFNKYFCSVANKINNNVQLSSNCFSDYLHPPQIKSCFLITFQLLK